MIQRITASEIPECVNVIKTAFLTVAEQFGFTVENAPAFTAFSMTEEKLTSQIEDTNIVIYGYLDNDIIIGYYSLEFLGDEKCELNNLCVLPKYRHKGIGGELLKHAFEAAKNYPCHQINIGIVEKNEKLKQWYQSYGFVHTGTKKFDFFPFTCGYMEKIL